MPIASFISNNKRQNAPVALNGEKPPQSKGFSVVLYDMALHGYYLPAATSSWAISRSLNFCTFIEGVIGKSSTKKTRLGTL